MKYKIMFTVKCHTWVDSKDYGDKEFTLDEAIAYERENAGEYVSDAISQGDVEIEVQGREENS